MYQTSFPWGANTKQEFASWDAPGNRGTALISPDGLYRYLLTRAWDQGLGVMVFIMLNPSTADSSYDDPTIRKCIHFAQREGYRELRVVNLFAFRATDRDVLFKAAKAGADIVGPGNDGALEDACDDARLHGNSTVVFAWGADPRIPAERIAHVRRITERARVQPMCLGMGKEGSPNHPCYLAHSTTLVPWKEQGR